MLERSGWRTRRLDRKHAVVVIVRSSVPRPGGRMRRQRRRRIHDDDSSHRPGGIDRCRARTAAQQHQAAEAGARPVHRKPVASKLDRPDHRPGEPGDRTAVRPGAEPEHHGLFGPILCPRAEAHRAGRTRRNGYGPLQPTDFQEGPVKRKSTLSASCRAEALARDADGIHPDEVLRFALYPRLEANVADRRALGLGIRMMRRAPH